ncbi:MAG: hypothetical protein ABH859_01515 [Pseudomonadota bacterium]
MTTNFSNIGRTLLDVVSNGANVSTRAVAISFGEDNNDNNYFAQAQAGLTALVGTLAPLAAGIFSSQSEPTILEHQGTLSQRAMQLCEQIKQELDLHERHWNKHNYGGRSRTLRGFNHMQELLRDFSEAERIATRLDEYARSFSEEVRRTGLRSQAESFYAHTQTQVRYWRVQIETIQALLDRNYDLAQSQVVRNLEPEIMSQREALDSFIRDIQRRARPRMAAPVEPDLTMIFNEQDLIRGREWLQMSERTMIESAPESPIPEPPTMLEGDLHSAPTMQEGGVRSVETVMERGGSAAPTAQVMGRANAVILRGPFDLPTPRVAASPAEPIEAGQTVFIDPEPTPAPGELDYLRDQVLARSRSASTSRAAQRAARAVSRNRIAAWVIGGLALFGLGVGVGYYIYKDQSDENDSVDEPMRTNPNRSTEGNQRRRRNTRFVPAE